jgi:formate-dependent nitrite reductase membrane component NrfD
MDKLAERNAGMAPHANQSSSAKRVYDQPSKGILWGWEVSAYIWTKGIASGTYLIAALMMLMGVEVTQTQWWAVIIIGFVFLGITGVLLILDLDRPTRFLYVMLRPNWSSWLVKGAYILAGFGGVLAASAGVLILGLDANYLTYLAYAGIPLSLLTGVYTAWLLQQAKGRSWSNDKMLPTKFLLETIAIGSAVAVPLLMPSVVNAIIGGLVLSVAFFHGKHVVLNPQMETLV